MGIQRDSSNWCRKYNQCTVGIIWPQRFTIRMPLHIRAHSSTCTRKSQNMKRIILRMPQSIFRTRVAKKKTLQGKGARCLIKSKNCSQFNWRDASVSNGVAAGAFGSSIAARGSGALSSVGCGRLPQSTCTESRADLESKLTPQPPRPFVSRKLAGQWHHCTEEKRNV